jgi:hypothetical protein
MIGAKDRKTIVEVARRFNASCVVLSCSLPM